jgi:hypothetical protein
MLAPILRSARAPVQPQFVRVQSCAPLLGVSVQTIRNYADDPSNGVEVRRTPGNHRLVNLAAITTQPAFCLSIWSVRWKHMEELLGWQCGRNGKWPLLACP